MTALGAATALLLALGAGACARPSRESAPPPATDPAPTAPAAAPASEATPAPDPGDPGQRARARFDEAHRAMVAEQDIDTGVAKLEQATALDPDFGEAWYQLGTARLTQAAIARPVDEQAAIGFFRSGVRACRRALELMDRGSMRVWDAFELRETQARLRQELELVGADVENADDATALAALGRWSDAQGYVDEPPAAEDGERESEPLPEPEGADPPAPESAEEKAP